MNREEESVVVKERRTLTVLNRKGLHTRPSTELVRCAESFHAKIDLVYGNDRVDAKSLISILMLAIGGGAEISIEADGHDAREAVDAIVELTQNKFYMSY